MPIQVAKIEAAARPLSAKVVAFLQRDPGQALTEFEIGEGLGMSQPLLTPLARDLGQFVGAALFDVGMATLSAEEQRRRHLELRLALFRLTWRGEISFKVHDGIGYYHARPSVLPARGWS